MAGTGRFVVIASAVGSLVMLCAPAADAQAIAARPDPVAHIASFPPGSIQGTVLDEQGGPVAGAVVSAVGGSSLSAVTDRYGRFELRMLPPGPYVVRARLAGFVTPPAQVVQVRSSARASSSIALRHVGALEPMLASVGAAPDPAPRTPTPPIVDTPQSPTPDEGETAWRIRHTRRSILKDVELPIGLLADAEPSGRAHADFAPRNTSQGFGFASDLFTAAPFSGQVNLLTMTSFDVPQQLFTPDSLASGIANVSLSAPVGSHADWTVRGALTQSDIAAWIVSGSYETKAPARHQYSFGLSYSAQRYDGGNPLALNGTTGSRSAGEVYAFDTFSVTPALAVTYGNRWSRYDYLDDRTLLSPRLELAVTPAEHVRISAQLSQRSQAPGAEEFLPPNESGIWLPPQRMFSSLDADSPMRAERAAHAAVELERDLGSATIAVRAFRQHVDDQLVTIFGARVPGQPVSEVGHYFVTNVGNAAATGCAASVRAALTSWLRGSVEYSMTTAQLMPFSNQRELILTAPSAASAKVERVHDVSTTLETRLPETATRVLVLYRLSNAFAHPPRGGDPSSNTRSIDSRFDVQVRQSLPFMNFTSAKWEMLLAVRNFFRDPSADGQSVYDELLVVRPPKRVVGGLSMHF